MDDNPGVEIDVTITEPDVDEGMTIPTFDPEPVPSGDEPKPATPGEGDEEDGLGDEPTEED